MSAADNHRGLALAICSSLFIGSSFIVKKKGLKKAGASGVRAGVGGYSYLSEPLWWAGMITMIVGEIANFMAYAFAPAVLVTPLGALSIIVSAALAHVILNERLHLFGIVGCVLCIVGSTTIVLHAPEEGQITSVKEVWSLATEPAFLLYTVSVAAVVLLLIFHFVPRWGHTQVMVYVGICSLMGSLSVMSVKALGIALKLTFQGDNQLVYPQTSVFAMVVVTCVLTQMNYLNKALDTFNTAVVSPIYYVMFTSLTILASAIMFKDWDNRSASQIITVLCGFVTILSGTFLLHATKDMVDCSGSSMEAGLQSSMSHRISIGTMISKHSEDETNSDEIPLVRHHITKGGLFRAGTMDNGDGIAVGISKHSEDELNSGEIPLVRHNAAKGGLFRAGTLDNGDGIPGSNGFDDTVSGFKPSIRNVPTRPFVLRGGVVQGVHETNQGGPH